MRTIYLKTLDRFKEIPSIKHVDRDRGQIDKYNDRPPVKFPCGLVSISLTKRKNLTNTDQMVKCRVVIRLAFERLADASSISPQERINKALEYYDTVEEVDAKFQGFEDAEMDAWECIATVDEGRPDLDIVRFTFETGFIKSQD